MLSVKTCRKLLGSESDTLTDREIEALRDQLNGLASVVVKEFDTTQRFATSESNVRVFKAALSSFIDDETVSIEERAAIIEYDGNLPRDEAERAAIVITLQGRDN